MSKARKLADLGNVYDDGALSNRNLIINGAMRVAQKGTQTDTTGHYTACDRYQFAESGTIQVTSSQEDDAPNDFSKSLKLECTNAFTTPSTGGYALLRQKLETQDVKHLYASSSGAKDVTLSFWVKSSKTGTYVLELIVIQTSGRKKSITYTVNSANTWEYKEVTFTGSGFIKEPWDNADNSTGLQLYWWLEAGTDFSSGTIAEDTWHTSAGLNRASGQVNWGDTVGATFQITGVQLEVGDTATPFEHRSYGDELARCQRYFHRIGGNTGSGLYDAVGAGVAVGGTTGYVNVPLKVQMRAKPSVTFTGTLSMHTGVTAPDLDNSNFSNYLDKNGGLLAPIRDGGSALTNGNGMVLYCQNSADSADFDAEL